jgi:predicted RNA-binding protein Jag
MAGARDAAHLAPQQPRTRRMQHELAREANLLSRSSGTDPQRHVTIYSNQ